MFFCEAVTLAHVARPLALARSLDPGPYDVHIACDPRYDAIFPDGSYRRHPLTSISGQQFLRALAKGSPLYDAETLRTYVKADLELISAVEPDVVIGDFRLSLAISARLAKVPYATITNAYWSPFAEPSYRVPDLPFARVLGPGLGQLLFNAVRPLAFALHTRPLNRVRREHGLKDLGFNLGETYTNADLTLYSDVPELIPTRPLPAHHQYIGSLSWQPEIPKPPWWDNIPQDRPAVYVTLGSTGAAELLPRILEILAPMPVTVLAATAERVKLGSVPENAFVADFLPGSDAAQRASLVICNGGSPTTTQALQAGVPVIGIASNLDQHLNMSYIERRGAGLTLRAERHRDSALVEAVNRLLRERAYREQAAAVKAQMEIYRPERLFPELIASLI